MIFTICILNLGFFEQCGESNQFGLHCISIFAGESSKLRIMHGCHLIQLGKSCLFSLFNFGLFFSIAIVSSPFSFDQFLTDVLRASPDREILACRAFAMFANLLGLFALPVVH